MVKLNLYTNYVYTIKNVEFDLKRFYVRFGKNMKVRFGSGSKKYFQVRFQNSEYLYCLT